MGATSWSYVVPYQADVTAALRALRDDVFRAGKYERPEPLTPEKVREAVDQIMSYTKDPERAKAERERIEQILAFAGPPRRLPKPRTIDQLVEQCGADGTHSILDIERVSPTPAPGAVSPVTGDELLAIFGTGRPTRAMAESKEEELCDLRERWQGVYLVVYSGDQPEGLVFAGQSGD